MHRCLSVLVAVSPLFLRCDAKESSLDFSVVEQRTHYECSESNDVHWEIVTIRWRRDTPVSAATALKRAGLELAELRQIGMCGDYDPTSLGDEPGPFHLVIFSHDGDSARFGTTFVVAAGTEVAITRVVSRGLDESTHRNRVGVVFSDFQEKQGEPGATDNPDDAQRSREDY